MNGKRLSKGAVALIVIAAIILVLAIVAVSVVFGYFNDFKYKTYTQARLDRAASVYSERQNNGQVKFIAHRGLSVEEWQNTSEAFRLAASYEGTWGIETDIWATKDGKFVCMHDSDSINGITNVREVDYSVATTTPLKDKSDRYACGFEEYLTICREGGKTAIVELKDPKMTDDDIKRAVDIIHGSGTNVVMISFHYDFLEAVRNLDQDIPLQLLIVNEVPKAVKGRTQHQRMDTLVNQKIDLSVHSYFLTKDMADYMHDHGRQIGVWTVNSARTAVCLVDEYNVDYVTSDIRMQDEAGKLCK